MKNKNKDAKKLWRARLMMNLSEGKSLQKIRKTAYIS